MTARTPDLIDTVNYGDPRGNPRLVNITLFVLLLNDIVIMMGN